MGITTTRTSWDSPVVGRLLERDGDLCTYCQRQFSSDVPPTKDHRTPLRSLRRQFGGAPLGSGSDMDNLLLACGPCNNLRGDMDEDYFREQIADGRIVLPWVDWPSGSPSGRRPGESAG